MRQFQVWAPDAGSVTLIPDGYDDTPMHRTDGGWWSAALDAVGPGDEVDYGYRIDGGQVRPDPRSRRQPDGVHGRSRTFDPAAHRWGDGDWTGRQLAGAVIYELHIGTFTQAGTLDAAAGKLDHLAALGVDFVELLPVGAFNGTHNWGYDGVLWYAVHEAYGGPAAYQRLVDACHQRGLGVIQDVVYIHLGASGNYLPEFGPYLASDGANTWGSFVNLDGPGSDEVRRYLLDNARMWLADYHVDGLRLDAVHALRDSRATHVLEALSREIDALSAHLGRPLSLIAESDLNDPRLYTPRAAGGYGLAASWNDDFHHALHVTLTGENTGYYADFAAPNALAKVLQCGYFHDGSYSSFRGRHHGRPIDRETTEAWRLVGFLQNHDQIGNRAAGDRLSATLTVDMLAVGAVVLLTAPFTPMLFMGEEWGARTPWQFFTSHPQADLAEATRQGRFDEFARHHWDSSVVPDPQDPETFVRSTLDWAESERPERARLLALYRELLALRRSREELTDPWLYHTRVETDSTAGWLVIRRGRLAIAVNLAGRAQMVPVPVAPGRGRRDVLLATRGDVMIEADGDAMMLPAHCAAIAAVPAPTG
jgi:maltooligosyltrehalose trehalohydrolase